MPGRAKRRSTRSSQPRYLRSSASRPERGVPSAGSSASYLDSQVIPSLSRSRPRVTSGSVGQWTLEDHDMAVLLVLERLVHQGPAQLPPVCAQLVELLLQSRSIQLLLVPAHEAARQDDGLVVPSGHGRSLSGTPSRSQGWAAVPI